jgi:hypothetical protein
MKKLVKISRKNQPKRSQKGRFGFFSKVTYPYFYKAVLI